MSRRDPAAEFREYENGVADVVAFLAGEARVSRNLRLHGSLSGKRRQFDVVARGELLGRSRALLVIDCKRWKATPSVKAVEAFIGMVRDVGADFGYLVSLNGASDGGRQRASSEDGIHVRTLSLHELSAWQPPGTIIVTLKIPSGAGETARVSLRHAGMRVRTGNDFPCAEGEELIKVSRHYGATNPSAELQSSCSAAIEGALASAQIEFVHVAHGYVTGGGTPSHRWLTVRRGGEDLVKVLVADEAQLEQEVLHLVERTGIDLDELTVDIPADWPVADTFDLGI